MEPTLTPTLPDWVQLHEPAEPVVEFSPYVPNPIEEPEQFDTYLAFWHAEHNPPSSNS